MNTTRVKTSSASLDGAAARYVTEAWVQPLLIDLLLSLLLSIPFLRWRRAQLRMA